MLGKDATKGATVTSDTSHLAAAENVNVDRTAV
jgi:hypothetical protein